MKRPTTDDLSERADQLRLAMRTMTKNEAKVHKQAWNQAIAEGRVVRFDSDGLTFRSFFTVAEARAATAKARRDGLQAEIVNPSIWLKDSNA